MNFSSMDYFVMVARERSFSRAAERLHITQQTLSAHIAKLEGELGAKLLVRSIPLELTYAGEVFLEYALDFQRRASSLEREFQDITENQRGLLRIGINYTRGDIVIPPLLIRFQQEYPNIAIRLVGEINTNLSALLENGEIDLAIAPLPVVPPAVQTEDFYQEEYVLVVSKALLNQRLEWLTSSGCNQGICLPSEIVRLSWLPSRRAMEFLAMICYAGGVSYRFQKLRYTIQRSGLSWFWPYLEWGPALRPRI